MNKALKSILLAAILPILVIGAWLWIGGDPARLRSSQIPPLMDVLRVTVSEIQNGYIVEQVLPSLFRYFIGLVLGCTTGLVLGIVTGRLSVLDATISPTLSLARGLPPVALAPFFIMVYGLNEWTRIGIIAYGTMFPVWVSVHGACKRLPERWRQTADSLGFNAFHRLFFVILPAIGPAAVSGGRLSIGIGYIMLFISEWIGAANGIGYKLSVAHTVSRVDYMIFGLVVLGTLSVLTDSLFRLISSRIITWSDQ